ncbi:MAG: hypothetical protein MPL62_05635, partial [Alphaproteobacteria bacterium]|nr:hypothetical protein [Alphaproteobacteria bacterium]
RASPQKIKICSEDFIDGAAFFVLHCLIKVKLKRAPFTAHSSRALPIYISEGTDRLVTKKTTTGSLSPAALRGADWAQPTLPRA